MLTFKEFIKFIFEKKNKNIKNKDSIMRVAKEKMKKHKNLMKRLEDA